MTPTISLTDAITGENIVREMNAEELAQYKIIQEEAKLEEKALLDKQKARQAVLQKLGLSEQEAAVLLG